MFISSNRAFETLVRCVLHNAGNCEEERLRKLLNRHIHYMAYRQSMFLSPFYGDLPTLPGSETPLNPSFLGGFVPDECLKGEYIGVIRNLKGRKSVV